MLMRDFKGNVYEFVETKAGIKLLIYFGKSNQKLKDFKGKVKKIYILSKCTIPHIPDNMVYNIMGERIQKQTYPIVEILD